MLELNRLFLSSQTITDKSGRAAGSSQVENNNSIAVLGSSHRNQLGVSGFVSLFCMDLLRQNSGTLCTPECNCVQVPRVVSTALSIDPQMLMEMLMEML